MVEVYFKTEDNPTVTKEYLAQAEEIEGETAFRREFLGEFVDEENTYFTMPLLQSIVHVCDKEGSSCEYCKIIRGEKTPDGELYGGNDPGGLSDPAALVIVERKIRISDGKIVFRVVYCKAFRISKEEKVEEKKNGTLGLVYTRFTLKVADVYKKLRFRKLLVDSTALGNPIVSHLLELKLPAEGLTLTVKTKEELFSNLKILMEQKLLEIPNDSELLAHLNCIVFERNRTGSYLFDHLKGTHDDLAYALALAVWAAGHRKQPVIVINTN